MVKKFDENICCSETSYNYLKNKLKNVCFIRNGVDVEHCDKNIRNKIRNELKLKEDDVVYVYGGVISNLKRVYELIKLFKDSCLSNEYLLIVGDGPLINECKSISNNKIIFTGFKTNIIDYFDTSDIYISYSSSEGFSISVIEALSSGLLCLLSDIPSHEECFKIDKKMYIGECFDEKNFEEKKCIISKNLKNTSKNSIKNFQKMYLSSESMAKLYCKKYEDLMAEKRSFNI